MSTDLVKRDENAFELGKVFAESGMFPNVRKAAEAVVKIIAGREFGLGPMAAMNGIHMVDGKPTLAANLPATRTTPPFVTFGNPDVPQLQAGLPRGPTWCATTSRSRVLDTMYLPFQSGATSPNRRLPLGHRHGLSVCASGSSGDESSATSA